MVKRCEYKIKPPHCSPSYIAAVCLSDNIVSRNLRQKDFHCKMYTSVVKNCPSLLRTRNMNGVRKTQKSTLLPQGTQGSQRMYYDRLTDTTLLKPHSYTNLLLQLHVENIMVLVCASPHFIHSVKLLQSQEPCPSRASFLLHCGSPKLLSQGPLAL